MPEGAAMAEAALPVRLTRPEITAPPPDRELGPVADMDEPHPVVARPASTTRGIN
jgi:hypothetical protein